MLCDRDMAQSLERLEFAQAALECGVPMNTVAQLYKSRAADMLL